MTATNRTITDEKMLSTARTLFTQLGFRAVGVDLIAKESGVSKMTMYRHFKSKEEVIAIYLEEQDQAVQKWFDSVTLPFHGKPRDQIIAIFDELQKSVRDEFYPGCPFQTAASEFPELDNPTHKLALQHKQSVLDRFVKLALDAGSAAPDKLANQLMLLYEGTLSSARMFGPENPARNAAKAAKILLNDSLGKKRKK